MPAVAVVGDERVEAWSYPRSAWELLKQNYRRLGLTMSCGKPGVPVTSPTGTQFFRHLPSADCQLHECGDETPEHFTAKRLVAEAARNLGMTATVERRSDDGSWIADVLLEHPSLQRPLAVEIQWSRQQNGDFHRRQSRYLNSEVACFWIVGPSNRANVAGVPVRHMDGTADDLTVEAQRTIGGGTESLPFAEVIASILRRLIRAEGDWLLPYVELTSTALNIETARTYCWREHCGRPMTRWRLLGVATESRCGQLPQMNLVPKPWMTARTEPALANVVTAALEASDLASPAPTAKTGSQSCPHCGKTQSDRYLAERDWRVFTVPWVARVPLRPEILRAEHLCTDTARGHCRPPDPAGTFPTSPHATLTEPRQPAAPLPPKRPRSDPERPWKTPAERKREAAERQAIRDAEAAEQRKRDQEQLKLYAFQRQAELERLWPGSPLRAEVLRLHGGELPNFLKVEVRRPIEIPLYMWQSELWLEFVHGQLHDSPVDPRHLRDHLGRIEPQITDPRPAIDEWLAALVVAGTLSPNRRPGRPKRIYYVLQSPHA